jgi:hypothetical protein
MATLFFWEKLDDDILNKPLIAQNIDVNDSYYKTILKHLLSSGLVFPQAIMERFNAGDKLAAYNAGIIGGTDIDFFKAYTEEAFRFIKENYARLNDLKIPEINMIYEQVLFYCLAKQKNTEVTCYLKDEVQDMTYPDFADFVNVPGDTKFIHLMGHLKKMLIAVICLPGVYGMIILIIIIALLMNVKKQVLSCF